MINTTKRLQKICYTLHGFLGRLQDWDMLSAHAIAMDAVVNIDILKIASPSECLGLMQWAQNFNAPLQQNERRVLMGYSLGGRLALHVLLDNPSLWQSAILVSAHSGLKTLEEKIKRLAQDDIWAKRFEDDPWDILMSAWNTRKVFAGKAASFKRLESEHSRLDLANILRYWSLGHQEDFFPIIAKLPMPILWIIGEQDNVYRERASSLIFGHAKSEVWVAPNAGHRVPWECRTYLQKVKQFNEGVLQDESGTI